MTLSPDTLDSLVSYWSNRLGVDADAFDHAAVTVGPADEDGIQLFRRDDALVVGVPESKVDEVRRMAPDLDSLNIEDEAALRTRFDSLGTVTAVFGPTFYGYTDDDSFAPIASGARRLTSDDEPIFERFRAEIPDEEWANGGLQFLPGKTVGLFSDDELVAVAGYDVWDDSFAHIAVVVHPDHRSEGHGRSVVSRVTEQALENGLCPQYRTSDEWPWSVALAERLGFERFVTATLICLE